MHSLGFQALSLNLVLNKFNSLAEFHFKVILSLDSLSTSYFLRVPADSRGNHWFLCL